MLTRCQSHMYGGCHWVSGIVSKVPMAESPVRRCQGELGMAAPTLDLLVHMVATTVGAQLA